MVEGVLVLDALANLEEEAGHKYVFKVYEGRDLHDYEVMSVHYSQLPEQPFSKPFWFLGSESRSREGPVSYSAQHWRHNARIQPACPLAQFQPKSGTCVFRERKRTSI